MKPLSYFPQIDSLRALAVLLVLLSHWLSDPWIAQLQLGKLGVELFFVISGFLITRILFRMKDKPPDQNRYLVFYARRFLRIFPIYYFVLLITFLFGSSIVRDSLFWNASFLTNFFILKIDAWPGPVSHFWTLAVEEQFYLVWPILIFSTPRRFSPGMMVGVVLLALFSRGYFSWQGYNLYYPYIFTLSCFDNLAAGALLAYFFQYGNRKSLQRWVSHPVLWLLALLFLGYNLYAYLHPGYGPWGHIFLRSSTSCLFFLLVGRILFLEKGRMRILLAHPTLVWMGKISYAAYLWHNFIPGFYLGLEHPVNPYLRFLLYLFTLIPLSHLSWKLIELPFNRLKKYYRY